MKNIKGREPYCLCSNCGFAFKKSKIFIKRYKQTAFCLCKKCALELAEEIKENYTEREGTDNDTTK